jgi:uncharacterized protein involved in type VI secretion and phage assembly
MRPPDWSRWSRSTIGREGNTTVRTMAPGYLFTLERCPRADQNREYLAVAVNYFFPRQRTHVSGQR